MESFSAKDSVVFSEGINLKHLMLDGSTFEIDANFKPEDEMKDPILGEDAMDPIFSDDVVFKEGGDSDSEEAYRNIEREVERLHISSPGAISFDHLASKMTDVIPSGDVKILILEEGTGPLISQDALVTLHYASYWENEKEPFDSTLNMNNGRPLNVRLGFGKLISGLEIGLGCVRGPRALVQLLLSPEAAWGSRGCLPRIRPEPCLFCVRLLDCQDVGALNRFENLSLDEKKIAPNALETAKAVNESAKLQFSKGNYQSAARSYHRAQSILQTCVPKNDAEQNDIEHMMVKILTNLCVCYGKLNMPKKIKLMCKEMFNIVDFSKYSKGLYHYGKACHMLGEHEEAEEHLKMALALEPTNLDIGRQLAALNHKNRIASEEEKKMYQKIFPGNKESLKNKHKDLDEDFKSCMEEIVREFMADETKMVFRLPEGLINDELAFVKDLIRGLDENLEFCEEKNEYTGELKRTIEKGRRKEDS